MACGAVHTGKPYTTVKRLSAWRIQHEPYVAAFAARSGWDYRRVDPGLLTDLTYGAFIELALNEHGEKKLEALKKMDSSLRDDPQNPGLPDTPPVNG
jgi:hypothetical protein